MAKIVFAVTNERFFHLLKIDVATDLATVTIIKDYFDSCSDHLAPVDGDVFGLFTGEVITNDNTVIDMITQPVATYPRGITRLTHPIKSEVLWLRN